MPTRPQNTGDGKLSVVATLRDAAGQTQLVTVVRTVTEQPIHIEAIPESGKLVPGMSNTVYFLTTYPDGRPVPARIAIEGFDHEVVTDALGAASIEFTPRPDSAKWLIRAIDNEGKIGRREVALEVGRLTEPFLVRTDKAVYDGGQTVHITALAAGANPLFLDVIKEGQTMLTTEIPIAGGHGKYELDLPLECFGVLQLCAYRLGEESLPPTQSRIIYVRQAGALKIDARLDQKEYRPGQRAELKLMITDAHGQPTPAAVSLAAVDEAVYSVLGQGPGLAPLLSAIEVRLLKPVYAIYAWSPDFNLKAPAADRSRLEQALFARSLQGLSNRDEFLAQVIRRYGENSQYLLRVLDRPDWEELVKNMPDLQKYIPLLRGEGSTYSLRNSSFREKTHRIESLRSNRLAEIQRIWMLLGTIFAFGALGWIAIRLKRVGEIITVVVIIFVLISLLLPAVQSAREASNRVSAQNDLRQIGMALEMHDSVANPEPKSDSAAHVSTTPAPRVREWFPETLLWRPELVTDDEGRASLQIDLADSITTWRLSASAISAAGSLGVAQEPIRVFQPFFVDLNLPVSLTRGDEVAVPVVVYNYLEKPLSVEIELADEPWFERLNPPKRKLDLAASEVRSVSYRLRARKVGRHELSVHASADGVADAIKRTVDVTPDGRRVEQTASGTLDRPADIAWSLPADAIEGSAHATVKIFPSTFSQLIEGLDGIFQMPYGCFEQTSSTTYPNVLALDYLRRTKKNAPSIEATAKQFIHLGYQRLLSFEIPGGGFDWFGNPPANRTLTAYGLMEFADMVRVHDVDPKLIERTRSWLLEQQSPDGSWAAEGRQFYHEDPTRVGGDLAQLSTTAYIAWAVFAADATCSQDAQRALNYLLRHEPVAIDDPYVLALVANALQAVDPNPRTPPPISIDWKKSVRIRPMGNWPGGNCTMAIARPSTALEPAATWRRLRWPHSP